jgi:hypothetical protein
VCLHDAATEAKTALVAGFQPGRAGTTLDRSPATERSP